MRMAPNCRLSVVTSTVGRGRGSIARGGNCEAILNEGARKGRLLAGPSPNDSPL